jgi:hypothetical protein
MRVRFDRVGRNRATWEARLADGPEPLDKIAAHLTRKRWKGMPVLRSRYIEVVLAEDMSGRGSIFAGFHKVGSFEVLPD